MTVTNTNLRNDYIGNGVATVYAFTFTAIYEVGSAKYSLKVITTDTDGVETLETQGTDYTVALASNGTGTITFATAPTSGHEISILPDMSLTQETDYIKSGSDKFPAESHEKALDKLTLIAKQFSELFKRSIKLPNNSLLSEITIPVESANADKAIVVNSTGDGFDAKDIIDINLYPVSAFAATLLDDANAAAARATLGVIIGTDVQAYDSDLEALAALDATAGFLVKTGANTYARRTITAGSGVSLSDGDGIAGNPVISFSAPPGSVVQITNTQTGAFASGSTTVPNDDTIMQNTQGNEFMTHSHTPQSATNILYILVSPQIAPQSSSVYGYGGLFKDSDANALATSGNYSASGGNYATGNNVILHKMTAGTTSAITFKYRAGSTSGTMEFNGTLGGRKKGGTMASSITVIEVKA